MTQRNESTAQAWEYIESERERIRKIENLVSETGLVVMVE